MWRGTGTVLSMHMSTDGYTYGHRQAFFGRRGIVHTTLGAWRCATRVGRLEAPLLVDAAYYIPTSEVMMQTILSSVVEVSMTEEEMSLVFQSACRVYLVANRGGE